MVIHFFWDQRRNQRTTVKRTLCGHKIGEQTRVSGKFSEVTCQNCLKVELPVRDVKEHWD